MKDERAREEERENRQTIRPYSIRISSNAVVQKKMFEVKYKLPMICAIRYIVKMLAMVDKISQCAKNQNQIKAPAAAIAIFIM